MISLTQGVISLTKLLHLAPLQYELCHVCDAILDFKQPKQPAQSKFESAKTDSVTSQALYLPRQGGGGLEQEQGQNMRKYAQKKYGQVRNTYPIFCCKI